MMPLERGRAPLRREEQAVLFVAAAGEPSIVGELVSDRLGGVFVERDDPVFAARSRCQQWYVFFPDLVCRSSV